MLLPWVTGIGYSDDKLLQTRIFSYADTQRHRLGPNYLLLPVNAPKCPHHNNHHDGFMNFMHRDEEVCMPLSHATHWKGHCWVHAACRDAHFTQVPICRPVLTCCRGSCAAHRRPCACMAAHPLRAAI